MQLYTSESTAQFNIRYERGTLDVASAASGICLGQSVSWCKNMLDGKDPKETKPSYERAAAVATIYLWALRRGQNDNDSLVEACRAASLVSQTTINGNAYTVFWRITHDPGVYLVAIKGHAMAAACQNNKYYFYDPSAGLWEYGSVVDFNRKMLEYPDYLGTRRLVSS